MQDMIEMLATYGASKIVQFGSSLWHKKYRDIDIFVEMPRNDQLIELLKHKYPIIDLHIGDNWEEFRQSLGITTYKILLTNQEEAQCL